MSQPVWFVRWTAPAPEDLPHCGWTSPRRCGGPVQGLLAAVLGGGGSRVSVWVRYGCCGGGGGVKSLVREKGAKRCKEWGPRAMWDFFSFRTLSGSSDRPAEGAVSTREGRTASMNRGSCDWLKSSILHNNREMTANCFPVHVLKWHREQRNKANRISVTTPCQTHDLSLLPADVLLPVVPLVFSCFSRVEHIWWNVFRDCSPDIWHNLAVSLHLHLGHSCSAFSGLWK